MRKQNKWTAALLMALCLSTQAVFPAAAGAAAPVVAPDPVLGVQAEEQPVPVEEQEAEELPSAEEGDAPALEVQEAQEARPGIAGKAAAPAESEDVPQQRSAREARAAARIWVEGYNASQGTISVRASGAPEDTVVFVAAWPGSAQDRQRVYEAQPASGGSWSADVPIADFGYAEGWYNFQALAGSSGQDAAAFVDAVSAPISFAHGTLRAAPADNTETAFDFILYKSAVPDNAVVWLKVDSEDGSSSRVYPLMRRAAGRTYRIYVSHYRQTGTYTATAYLGSPTQISSVLGTASFTVDGVRDAKVQFVDVDGSTGQFAVTLAGTAPSGFESVRFAVWSAADRSDLKWYDGEEKNGQYQARTDIDAHGGLFGTFTAQAHAVLGNGIEMMAGEATAEITPNNYVYVERQGPGAYRVAVMGPDPLDAAAFRTATWSEKDGQDDVVWYKMSLDDNGEISAVVKLPQQASAGTYIAYVYSAETLVGSAEFNVPEAELLSPAEERIARDCERVYNMVGTDLYDNYMWVVNTFSYIRRYGHLEPDSGYTREQWYAVEGLENQSGNCYTFAAAFCELAKGLGYDATYVEGAVFGVGQQWWPHGFVLIRRNGSTYICDPELQFASSTGRNLYMQPISSPKATYRW